MITFLSSPKPFIGIAKDQQYRAIRSWQATGKDVEIILYGVSDGIDQAGSDLNVKVVRQINSSSSGIPYFGSIVEHAAEHGKYDYQVYLNCDILLSGILQAMCQIEFTHFLLIGQRIDLGEDVFVDLGQMDLIPQLAQLAVENKAVLHSPTGIDYFGFCRGMWQNLPEIIVGRGGYDNALIAYCMKNRIPIVDGTFRVTALHQFHDYGHLTGGVKAVMHGSDAIHNFSNGGVKRSRPLVSDAGYVLKGFQVISWPCRGDWLRRLELQIRHENGRVKTAMAIRLIWRVLNATGITGVSQLQLDDIITQMRAQIVCLK